MAVKSRTIQTENIEVGMYVSGLDCPWIDTDYVLEGFYIESFHDIEKIQQQCQFVYIDTELTEKKMAIIASETSLLSRIKTIATTDIKDIHFSKTPKKTIRRTENLYKKTTSFTTEFRTANQLYKEITITAAKLFSDMHTGKNIDLRSVKRSATAVVDSVVRNPDAFLWLTRLHKKDTHTHNRSLRTSIWAIAFARYLGLEKEKLISLSTALLLCNIGKAKLPIELLEKEDHLDEKERLIYQNHVDLTLDALKIMGRTPQAIISIIKAHCERFDGSGYPEGLSKDKIPLLAQIAGLVSYYEEITNCRVPEDSLDPTRAVEHLYNLRNEKFYWELVEEFICSIGIYPIGAIVELNSKEIAIIVEQNNKNQLLPQVLILRDINRQPVTQFKVLDLYEIHFNAHQVQPKIIDTFPLETFGITMEEVTLGLARATQGNNKSLKFLGLKDLLKKIVS